MQRQFDPAASSAALAAAQYWKEQQAESMQGEITMPMFRTSLACQTSWYIVHVCIPTILVKRTFAGGSCQAAVQLAAGY